MLSRRCTQWIIELDHDADPEVSSIEVMEDLADHLSGARGQVGGTLDRIIFDDGNDALSTRMRFSEYVVRIERVVA